MGVRIDAVSAGLKKYFTGKPCPQGHVCERYSGNGQCIKCAAEKIKRWEKNNRPRLRELRRRYDAKRSPRPYNSEKAIERIKRYRKKYPERVLLSAIASVAKRRALKKEAGLESFTKNDIKTIYRLQKGKCAYCKTVLSKKFHVDHIYPISKGGSNKANNIQLTCRACNLNKSARDPIDFAQQRGMLL